MTSPAPSGGAPSRGAPSRASTVRGGAVRRRAIAAPAPGQPHPEPGPRPAGQRLDGGHLRAEPHLRAQPGQQRTARLPVQRAERHGGHPDVGGVPGPQQRGLHHGGGQRQVGVIAVHVERGHREQVPQHPPRPLVLPVGGEPVTQPLPVKLRFRRVQGRHGERGPAHAQPLGAGEEAVAHEGLAHVQRAGQRGPAQACPSPRRQHGDVEPVLQRRRPGHAEPGEQAAVGHAAAQEHVLAVVDHEAAAAERGGRTAQAGPGLGQRDVGAHLAERDRGGDAGQAATDHDDLARRAHRAAPFPAAPAPRGRSATTSDRAATSAFSRGDSDIRRSRTTPGVAAIRSSSRW